MGGMFGQEAMKNGRQSVQQAYFCGFMVKAFAVLARRGTTLNTNVKR